MPDWLERPGVAQTLELVRALGAATADPRMVYVVPEAAQRVLDDQARQDALAAGIGVEDLIRGEPQ